MFRLRYYNRRITKENKFYDRAREVIKSYGIRFRMRWDRCSTYALSRESYVNIGMLSEKEQGVISIQHFLSCVAHEIGHVLNYRNKKFFKYHNTHGKCNLTRDEYRIRLRDGLRGEIYTDKIGYQVMKEHFPEIRYLKGYTKANQEWYRTIFQKEDRENLRKANERVKHYRRHSG
ncbi:MAG: hypothetical protein V3U54_08520 [Thermodesulfobacteriota bacterium]